MGAYDHIDSNPDGDLTDRQQSFIDEMLLDPSSTSAAAIRAGYAATDAYSAASRLMATPKILKAIEERRSSRMKRLNITEDRVLQELALIAFAKPGDVIKFTPGEDPDINVENVTNDTDTPSEVTVSKTNGKKSSKTVIVKTVKMADKLTALEKLGKHMNMFKDKIEITGKLSLEQLVEASMNKIKEENTDAASSGD